jgi:hypothetical protein
MWVEEFGSTVVLDAADALSFNFMRALREFTDQINPGCGDGGDTRDYASF